MAAFPAWEGSRGESDYGYSFINSPPRNRSSVHINTTRLLIQAVVLAAITGAGIVTAKSKPGK
jgi:hypothetical protein